VGGAILDISPPLLKVGDQPPSKPPALPPCTSHRIWCVTVRSRCRSALQCNAMHTTTYPV